MDHLNSCTSITIGCDDEINHIAFDGCAYFCTITNECEIIKLDDCFRYEKRFGTCREYDCICYDWCERCFWASSDSCFDKIFKLDCEMREIDCLRLRNSDAHGVITGLSYQCCNNTLLVSFLCGVVEVEKCSETVTPRYSPRRGCVMGVLSLCPGMVVVVLRNEKFEIEVLDAGGEKQKSVCVPGKIRVKNLLFNPCGRHCGPPLIQAFVLKNCRYPYLCNYPVDFDGWGFAPCHCNYKICRACCCEEPRRPGDACADLIESVALVEAALSHILNAEGEKIQKALEKTDDIEKLLCVNREVNKTIVNATHLEHVLYAKLNTLTELGDFCGPRGKPVKPPCQKPGDFWRQDPCCDGVLRPCEDECGN